MVILRGGKVERRWGAKCGSQRRLSKSVNRKMSIAVECILRRNNQDENYLYYVTILETIEDEDLLKEKLGIISHKMHNPQFRKRNFLMFFDFAK